ncbi:MAG: diacylglycerol kinase family lipid kinase [Acidobacteria bacterium]|nr:diacylglycerol kinase family lipid kinase [Acidobacteriota bacterium]MBS1864477.1 diacylglycerol kinase family lipid kinase [Acidobacteriota bacterium]
MNSSRLSVEFWPSLLRQTGCARLRAAMFDPASSDSESEIVSPFRAVAVFANPASGSGRSLKLLPKIKTAFEQHGFRATIYEMASPEELEALVRKSIAEGFTHLFTFGGDGTLHNVINAAYGRDMLFGVIPSGGGNDFARALHLPLNPLGAISAACLGTPRPVDLVRVRFADGTTRFYLGGGGVGLDSESASLANSRYRNLSGRLRYVLAAVHAYLALKPQRIRIALDDSSFGGPWQRFVLASLLNTPTFGAGIQLSPGARIDDGLLDYAFLPELRFGQLLRALPRLLINGVLSLPNIERKQVRRVRIETETPAYFQGDGELMGLTPVEIEVIPRAVRFLAPKAQAG